MISNKEWGLVDLSLLTDCALIWLLEVVSDCFCIVVFSPSFLNLLNCPFLTFTLPILSPILLSGGVSKCLGGA